MTNAPTFLPRDDPPSRRGYSSAVEGGRQVQVRYRIRGRFQPSTYARFVAERARWLAIRGWMRVGSDGAVELLAAGPEALVGALEMACTLGPLDALVDNIEAHADDSDPGQDFVLR